MPGPRGVTEGSPLSRCGHVASALRRRVWAPCVALSLLPSSTSCSLWPPSLRPVRRGPACPCGPLLFLLVLWSCPASPMPSQERRGWVAGSFPVTQSHTQCWSEAFLGGGGTAVCASAAQGDGGRGRGRCELLRGWAPWLGSVASVCRLCESCPGAGPSSVAPS